MNNMNNFNQQQQQNQWGNDSAMNSLGNSLDNVQTKMDSMVWNPDTLSYEPKLEYEVGDWGWRKTKNTLDLDKYLTPSKDIGNPTHMTQQSSAREDTYRPSSMDLYEM